MFRFRKGIRLIIKGFLRIALRVYYRSIQVQGRELFPEQGPVLLVANHPNSLVDPAVLVDVLSQPVHFGANHKLFASPMRLILEAFGAIPLVRPQDDPRGQRRNLEAFDRYLELLLKGRVAAIFPEGLSQDDPQLASMKTGAARIALQAESAASFDLNLSVVPVGLQFEPRRRFRADAFIRFGVPLKINDLSALYSTNPREAVRELTARIDTALKSLAFHVAATERVPFVERLVDVYLWRARQTGLSGVDKKGLRGELLYRMAACFNHYVEADPGAVSEVEHQLQGYERLREKAGLQQRLLEEPSHLLPGPLGPLQATAEALLGALPALFGWITGAVPYHLTDLVARRIVAKRKHPPSFSIAQILVGAILFPVSYGLEVWWVWSHASDEATMAFIILLVPTGLFARLYSRRVRKLAAHVGGRAASWMKLEAVAQVLRARRNLLRLMDDMRDRYRVEVLGWFPVSPRRSLHRRTLVGGALLMVLIPLLFFVVKLRDRSVVDLPEGPSLWSQWRHEDPDLVRGRLERDTRGAVSAIAELERLEKRMQELREAFARGKSSYYSQQDQETIQRLLLTYLNLRTALLRTIWSYRAAHDAPGEGELEARAFLLAYASAATLLAKAAALVETFEDDSQAQRKLNEGDLAWEMPGGTYDRLLASLSNADVVSGLQAAAKRYDSLAESKAWGRGPPWEYLVQAAVRARPAIDRTAARIGSRKLALAFREMRRHAGDPVYHAQTLVSTWLGDFRLIDRPRHRGLISPQQVGELRKILQPGDILLERRNWFLSNAFLPGFWPHAALYLGNQQELEALGVADDPRVTPHRNEFLGEDEAGHPYAVIEAISEGVVFTSLEHSVGEADAVAVLRPRLSDGQRREAIARAFSHHEKPYDFEFDFFSNDRLVCSELVYRAYDGMLTLPLTRIMGRQTLPVNTFVEVYAEGHEQSDSAFKLLLFLDMDEKAKRAFTSSDVGFIGTLRRSRFTFWQSR